nr:hypothetical protein [Ramlibacter paludis]
MLVTLATVAYPLVVYLGFGRWNPLWVALLLAALLFLRAWSSRDLVWLAAGCGALLLGAATTLGGGWLPLKLYPVLLSAVLLAVFAFSLWKPPTIVERIARITEPDLPPQGVAYTRKVTVAWCGFFIVNGAISLATTMWGSEQAWLLYNGLLSYALMGAFFAGEWLLRQRMRARVAAAGQHG